MFDNKLTQPDLFSIDHDSRQSSSFQSRSLLEDRTSSLRQSRSSANLKSSLRARFSQWRDRRLSTSRQQTTSSAAFSIPAFSSSPNSTLPDVSSILTASNQTTAFKVNTQYIAGSLRADLFRVSSSMVQTVISGNGNVDFGSGYRDLLDLSDVSLRSVGVNLGSQTGGVVYNPGNGSRVFDAINFADGRQILFEGIDTIRFAEGDYSLSVIPNDPDFGRQWNLHMMGVHNAWRFTTGSNSVLIGVGDSGLSMNNNGAIHPELQRTIALGNQVIDDTRNDHGTSVQGIIAATSNNGIGMSGINWNSTVFNIDILGGEDGDLTTANAAQAMIDQARQNGQRLVINFSIQVRGAFDTNHHPDLEQIVRNNPDVLFVISAGNFGHLGNVGLSSPAILARSYSNVMAVGSSWGTQALNGTPTIPGTRVEYNFGGSQYGLGLTVMGPSEVIAPNMQNVNGTVQFDFNPKFSGTSAAAPNVTGVASLLLSANPYLSASQVRQILSQTAIDLSQPGYDITTGHGFVNADAAVRRAMALSRGYA